MCQIHLNVNYKITNKSGHVILATSTKIIRKKLKDKKQKASLITSVLLQKLPHDKTVSNVQKQAKYILHSLFKDYSTKTIL